MQNLSLYVFIGSAKNMKDTRDIMSIELDEASDLDRIIRTTKAEIQSSEAVGIDIQRINIYVIANAHEPDPDAGKFVRMVGDRLKILFSEDFVSLHISLLVFLSESNELDAGGITYETRCRFSYEFLLSLTSPAAFDRIFLLSDRNEHGFVSPTNHQSAYDAAMHLPFLQRASSQFGETMNLMEKESGRVLFASLGFCAAENKANVQDIGKINYLADILENELRKGECRKVFNLEAASGQIISDIAGVAANTVTMLNLFGVTLKEAEDILYGDRACRFFAEKYKIPAAREEAMDTLELSALAAEERQITQVLHDITDRIRNLDYELNEKQNFPLRLGFLHTIDKIKDAIGECYVIKYQLAHLNFEKARLSARQSKIKPYIEYMHDVVLSLKALQNEPAQEVTPEELLEQAKENAALNISLLRNDGLIYETHVLGEPDLPCVLRLVGGFALEDLTRFKAMQAHKDYLP